jgi:hypothetical protein
MYDTIEEKENDLLQKAIDKSEKKMGYEMVQSETNKAIFNIIEDFIKQKKLICYGGTAINNILPKKAQFYNKNFEVPDYDVFSKNALKDAKELVDLFFKKGYESTEVRSAIVIGTYKIYVNFVAVVDVTQMDPRLYEIFKKNGIKKEGILYSPVNFLRMEMYKELSHPQGEISRWEKVLKRLALLNKYYPIHNDKCYEVNFMRDFKGKQQLGEDIYDIIKKILIEHGVVFFGGYAINLYSRYMPLAEKKVLKHIPDFDVLSTDAKQTAEDVKKELIKHGFHNIKINKKDALWKIIPVHYEIVLESDIVCVIYETIACHSYNTIKEDNETIKVASIETMFNFLFAFLFKDDKYYDHIRIMCMAEFLFQVQQKNRLKQKGLLKRFSTNCYGTQITPEKLREIKSEKFIELQDKKGSKEYEKYFIRYNPLELLERKKIETKRRKRMELKNSDKNSDKNKKTLKKKLLSKFINPFNNIII